jgi:hypothetical protein
MGQAYVLHAPLGISEMQAIATHVIHVMMVIIVRVSLMNLVSALLGIIVITLPRYLDHVPLVHTVRKMVCLLEIYSGVTTIP